MEELIVALAEISVEGMNLVGIKQTKKFGFTVVELTEDVLVYGVKRRSNDKTQSNDIRSTTKKYYDIIKRKSGEVIPFFVISKGYEKNTKDFDLFTGGLLKHNELESFTIQKGTFIRATIKPKMGFLWGSSIGEAKRTFYEEWLPKTDFSPLNMEYEYHSEISIGKNPQIDIFFAVVYIP